MPPSCGTCWRRFPGFDSRDHHCREKNHRPPEFECDTCGEAFGDEWERRDHMDWEEHWHPSAPRCEVCYDRFPTTKELETHEIQVHRYCADCQRFFRHPAEIRQHLNSRRHRTYVLPCPFCNQTRNTATGLVCHLEMGGCRGMRLTQDALFQSIQGRDPNGYIAKQAPVRSGIKVFEATERAWNPCRRAFECYLCHGLFRSLKALNAHLLSPRHRQKLYHCPNHRRCPREFTTLAGLINHLESEKCRYMRFDAVQASVRKIIASNRMIDI